MVTIRNEEGTEGGEEYDVRRYQYFIKRNGGSLGVECVGYNKVFKCDKNHQKYKDMLNRKGLWGIS